MFGKFIWNIDKKGICTPIHGDGGHITPIDYYRMNWILHRIGFQVEALRTNIYEVPLGYKRIPFTLLNQLIKLTQRDKYNMILQLGESLILKVRKQ